MHPIVYFLLIGLVAGWLAGQIMGGRGFGLVGNLLVGIVGAILGGYLFGGIINFADGLVNSLVCATLGAILLLVVASFIQRRG